MTVGPRDRTQERRPSNTAWKNLHPDARQTESTSRVH